MLYKWSQTRCTSCNNLIFPLHNFYESVPIPIQNNMHCWWIEIKKSPKYKLNDNIGDFSKTTFCYHSNDTNRNLWVMMCSHCPINDSSGWLHITKITFWYHSNDNQGNRWVMLRSHWPINYLSGSVHITVYLAVMLQSSWHTAEGN